MDHETQDGLETKQLMARIETWDRSLTFGKQEGRGGRGREARQVFVGSAGMVKSLLRGESRRQRFGWTGTKALCADCAGFFLGSPALDAPRQPSIADYNGQEPADGCLTMASCSRFVLSRALVSLRSAPASRLGLVLWWPEKHEIP